MSTHDTYRQWKEQLFGSEQMIWHDGLDERAASGLRGAAREDAVRMLRLGLAQDDAHAAQALAAMDERGASDEVRALLHRVSGGARVRVALALFRLAADAAMAAEISAVLARMALHWGERIDAAMALRHFADDESERALLAAIDDDEYLVRYHACDSLLVRWRVKPSDVGQHRDIFALIAKSATGSERLALSAEARTMLLALRSVEAPR